jgi:ubiquitin-protein ligase
LNENNIYYEHDNEDMLKGYALIVGPKDTPYFGGYYFFEFIFPNNYPYSPPSVLFKTNMDDIRFNPNLYTSGKVCISILNTWFGDNWSSCQTIKTILLAMLTIFIKNPLLNEPGMKTDSWDFDSYSEIIEYANIDIAICEILIKTKLYFPFFDLFDSFIKESFLKNYDEILQFIVSKIDNTPPKMITTRYCNLRIKADYLNLKKKIEDCHNHFFLKSIK